MILVLRHEAEADILEAFRWYESKRAGLGDDFVGEVDAAFDRALEAPQSFPVAYRTLRRIVLRPVPRLLPARDGRRAGVRRVARTFGGQQRRVAIARALMMKPEALLFDDPQHAITKSFLREASRRAPHARPASTMR